MTDRHLGEALTEAEANELPIFEAVGPQASRVIVPKRGSVIREDGTVKLAVMRPCISRGKRIRNMPPIYTPGMLAENADVFTGWPMFRDHAIIVENAREAVEEAELLEGDLEEAVKKLGRSVDDLAGRIVRSWYDPEVVYEDDADFGYQAGAIVAYARLIKPLREKVADDPALMEASVNAYPKSGRPGYAAWAPKVKGMVIEGIRRMPRGSVDIVVRGGAGGRFLMENDPREVSSAHRYYDAPQMAEVDLTKLNPQQLREHVAEHAPHLLPALAEQETPPPAAGTPPAATPPAPGAPAPQVQEGEQPLTRAELDKALQEAQSSFAQTLAEKEKAIKEEGEAQLREDRQQQKLAAEAKRLIESAKGIPPRWKADLIARYAVTPEGPTAALARIEPVMEGETVKTPAEDVLKEAVTGDIEYAVELIAEAAGKPVVRAQGGEQGGGGPAARPAGRQWDDELAEMNIVETDDDGKVDISPLIEELVG